MSLEAFYRRLNKKAEQKKRQQQADAAMVSQFMEHFAPETKERTHSRGVIKGYKKGHSGTAALKRKYGG